MNGNRGSELQNQKNNSHEIFRTRLRGIDVFSLTPSEYLSEAEVAAAGVAEYNGLFNPQTQMQVTWPAEPVVAMAYLDQLQRSDSDLAGKLVQLADSVDVAEGDTNTLKRRSALGETLRGIAARLR